MNGNLEGKSRKSYTLLYDPRCEVLGECKIQKNGVEAKVNLYRNYDENGNEKYVMREKKPFGSISPPYEPEEAKELIVDEDLGRLNF